jgi:uridine kinase
MRVCMVGIGGGSASGKTTLARHVVAALPGRASLLALDQYYRDGAGVAPEERLARNYDAPEAFEWLLLLRHLDDLAAGREINAPCYDYARHMRRPDTLLVPASPIVVIEGIHVLSDPALRARLSLKVFVETPLDLCLARRLARDTAERGRSTESVIEQYMSQVRPMHFAHVLPGRTHADLVVSGEDLAGSAALVAAAVRTRQPG